MENKTATKYEFWDMFRFTKDGKPKSSVLVNSFSLSLAVLIVTGLAYWFLIDVIEGIVVDRGCPIWLANTLESLVPALIATGLFLSLTFLFKNKAYVFYAYLWNLFYAILFIGAVLLFVDEADRGFLLRLSLMIIPAPLLLGLVGSFLLGIFLPNRKRRIT
ncbi:MAG: hypothetical protein GX218_08770 [Clostridiaceae bacterium]|nr:hypothetical protein [Clostridiaceae bacterium]